jgi:2-octaprenyl-6-methoxyphenol hydroxylase
VVSKGRTSARAAARADCVIAGGGLVGATLAIALADAGLEVVVADRADPETVMSLPYDGRTCAIAYGSQRLLAAIGVWPGMVPAAEPIRDIRISDGGSPLFLHFSFGELGDRYAGAPFGWIVENRATRRALYERARAIDGLTIRWRTSVADWSADAATARVRLDDGAVVDAPLLIAADGADSMLRRRARIAATQWAYPQTAIVCVAAHERPHRGVAHERFLPPGPFALLPMTDDADGGHRSSVVWTEDPARVPGLLALPDDDFSFELQRRFGDWYGDMWVEGPRWSYPLRLLHAETYLRPRFALIGDAAHTIHPIAGQGLNLGLRDVAALAEVLVDAHRLGLDLGATHLLRRYERWRRFDNTALMAGMDGLNRLFSNDVLPVRWARDVGIAAVNRMPALKRFFMQHAMGTVGVLPRLIRGEPL